MASWPIDEDQPMSLPAACQRGMNYEAGMLLKTRHRAERLFGWERVAVGRLIRVTLTSSRH